MFECFEKTIVETEANDAKAKGVPKEDIQKKNLHNAAKIVVRNQFKLLISSETQIFYGNSFFSLKECYEEIDDN